MANTDYESVDEYIATFPKDVQAVLQRVRGIIRKSVPGIHEQVSYQIAGYKVQGRAALYLAGWKDHISLYPATDALVAALGAALTPHRVSKGTLRFPLSEPLPVKLIARIAKLRAAETAELAEAKTKARTKPAKKAPKKKAAKKKAAQKKTAKPTPKR